LLPTPLILAALSRFLSRFAGPRGRSRGVKWRMSIGDP
jgi:hypothetical protein